MSELVRPAKRREREAQGEDERKRGGEGVEREIERTREG